ncbi:MAG: V-type ATP synthase subunit D [Candidatus Methanospirareceae archaeon]
MVEVVIEGVSPTRMELLRLNRKVKLAEKGHDLLREKRDALITELLDAVSEVRDARKEVERKLKEAFEYLIIAQALLGVEQVRQLSFMASREEIPFDFSSRNIMGVSIPSIELAKGLSRKATERGYSFVSSSAAVDKCASSFEKVLEDIIKLAEAEEGVRRLAEEVEKTKRRVNALEYILIPKLKATRKYIRMRLEEMERDNFMRLKKIKAILERRAR